MKRKWTECYMRNRFPEIVRSQRISQGLDPNKKPSHKWLRNNGHRQFLRRVRDLGYTPDEFLIQECGFEPPKKGFPCNDTELKRELEDWFEYEDNVATRRNGRTIDDARCHLRRIMEISGEYAGTHNLLKFGRGDISICTRRAMLLMEGLAEEFENEGTRSNYVTTFRDFIQAKCQKKVIYHDVITPLVERNGWTTERSRPQYLPSASLVKSYYNACNTLTEQMVILSLAGFGLRPSDTEKEHMDQLLVLEADTPHLAFSQDRKNGVGKVPIVKGLSVIREYKSRLEMDPEYEGSFFPSDRRACGSRSTQWIRDTVERIGQRVDETMDNGEKPKPKDLRQFWYTTFLTAWCEWLDRCNNVGDMQGTSAPLSVSTYAGDAPWFDTYVSYVEPILNEAFPACMEETIADDLGNVDVNTDSESKLSGQIDLDAFIDSPLSSLGVQGYAAAAVAVPAKVIERAVEDWVAGIHKALKIHPKAKYYPLNRMPLQRKIGLFTGLLIVITATVYGHYRTGQIDAFLSGEPSAIFNYVIMFTFSYYMTNKWFPSVDEALQAAEEQNSV